MSGMSRVRAMMAAVVMMAQGALACDAGGAGGGGEADAEAFREWCVEPAPEGLGGDANALMSLVVADAGLAAMEGFGVAVNGEVVDVRDDGRDGDAAAGDGAFSVPVAVDEAPAGHACYEVLDGEDVQERGFELECKTVPCPPNCTSILFGEPCVVCLECTFKIKTVTQQQSAE